MIHANADKILTQRKVFAMHPTSDLKTQAPVQDNRPETIAQRKLQGAITNATVQLSIDSTNFEKTSNLNPHYVVNPNNRHALYGAEDAATPQPAELYAQLADTDEAGEGRTVKKWVPNVRFFSDKEATQFGKYVIENKKLEKIMLGAFKTIVESGTHIEDKSFSATPKIGIMGKNDCFAFATTLYNAIARSKFRKQPSEEELVETVTTYTKDYPEVEVGDLLRHIFEANLQAERDIPYHAATVVAKEGDALVTLEANVGKNLHSPEFFIRGGSGGFVKANIEDGETGDKLEVSKYQSGMPSKSDIDMYGHMDMIPTLAVGNVGTYEHPSLKEQDK